MPTVRSTYQVPNFLGPYDPNRPILPGINEPTGGGAGTLFGAPGIGGSSAAGRIPQVPNPTDTASSALAGNLANLAKLRQLFNRTSAAVGIGPGMTGAESANINSLLNPPAQFVDINRMAAEAGTGQGIAGSPAAETRGYRMTDEERLRRQLLGSQLLNQRASRANQILPLQNLMQTPQDRQFWQNFANTVAAGADPEQAFQRAMQLAREGINRGYNAGYGGGVPAPTAFNQSGFGTTPSVPTWPTLPTTPYGTVQQPSGPASVFAPPPTNFNPGEDFLQSLGLGLNQPGVTVTPTSSFMGDINIPSDLYA